MGRTHAAFAALLAWCFGHSATPNHTPTGGQQMNIDRAEYLAGYLAGTGAVPVRIYYANHEPHYARGLQAGFAAAWCGVDLSACV